jgi:hypothetical protein
MESYPVVPLFSGLFYNCGYRYLFCLYLKVIDHPTLLKKLKYQDYIFCFVWTVFSGFLLATKENSQNIFQMNYNQWGI